MDRQFVPDLPGRAKNCLHLSLFLDRVTVDDDGKVGPECLVEFGDGVTVIAEWQAEDDAILLSVPDYRTAKGTLVTARNWWLARGKDGLWRSERLPQGRISA